MARQHCLAKYMRQVKLSGSRVHLPPVLPRSWPVACATVSQTESNRVQHEQFLLGPTSRLRRLATVVEVFVAGVLGATAAARSRTAFKYRGFIGGDRKISSFI
jgi:hypothetical protein